MTNEQYERWQDFALRMARTCYRTARRPSAKWIEAVVEDWFDRLDECDIPCIVNWDNSTEYPVGNLGYGRQSTLSWCGCEGYRNKHGEPNPACGECHGSGLHYALYCAQCVSDGMTEFLYEYEPGAPRCRACEGDDETAECRCDEVEQGFWEQWDDQWGGPVHCCIRAGLDCASEPSAGVVGFTAGDLREMYPEGVPDWVFPPDEQLEHWPGGEPNGVFSELPDSMGVVL